MKKLNSIFTDDTDVCYYTETPCPDHHHIFGAFNRQRSEQFGFSIPLHPKLHPNGVEVDDDAIRSITGFDDRWALDLWLKQECQRYYEDKFSHDEWMEEFGESWL